MWSVMELIRDKPLTFLASWNILAALDHMFYNRVEQLSNVDILRVSTGLHWRIVLSVKQETCGHRTGKLCYRYWSDGGRQRRPATRSARATWPSSTWRGRRRISSCRSASNRCLIVSGPNRSLFNPETARSLPATHRRPISSAATMSGQPNVLTSSRLLRILF